MEIEEDRVGGGVGVEKYRNVGKMVARLTESSW